VFPADEGLGYLEMHELLRPEDIIVAVTLCIERFFVRYTDKQLDMGTTVEEVESRAEVSGS
jgi:hypothetical protein